MLNNIIGHLKCDRGDNREAVGFLGGENLCHGCAGAELVAAQVREAAEARAAVQDLDDEIDAEARWRISALREEFCDILA